MSEAKFAIGDMVHHRASGERGVVVDIYTRCTVHPPLHSSHIAALTGGSREDCEYEFAGTYDLSIGLGRVLKDVPEGLLEECTEKGPLPKIEPNQSSVVIQGRDGGTPPDAFAAFKARLNEHVQGEPNEPT